MSAEVQQFTFNGSAFRALNDESGESWFSGQDVCNILGTGTNHLREYLDEDEITNIRNTDIAQNGGKAPVFISEPGLYKLIMRSRKPEAKEFQRWVTHEVLPSHVRSAMANSAGLINVNAVSRRALRSHFAPNRVPQPRSRYFACTSSWHRVQSLCRSLSQSASHIVRSRSQYRPQVVPGISDSKTFKPMASAWRSKTSMVIRDIVPFVLLGGGITSEYRRHIHCCRQSSGVSASSLAFGSSFAAMSNSSR